MSKKLLVESFSKDWQEPLTIRRLPIQESAKTIVREGKEYTVREKLEVPVWKLGKKNLNGRTYRESLGKRMADIYKESVTANLADHPDEDGSVKDILSVAKNPHIRDGIMYVDAYIVDEAFEKKLHKMIEAGFGMGVSSSVYGDTESDGTVIDESVELDRWFDWVLQPSYGVFVTDESIQTEKIIKESVTIDNKESITMPDNKMQTLSDKLTEKIMRDNLAALILDADKKETIAEKITALEDAASYLSESCLPDVLQDIKSKIENLKRESLELAEKGKTVDKLSEDIQLKESEKLTLKEEIEKKEKQLADLQEKFDKSCKLLDETKAYANNAVTLLEISDAEAGSKFSAREYLDIVGMHEKAEEQIKSLKQENSKTQRNLETAKLALEKANSELSILKESFKKLKEDYDQVTYVEPAPVDNVGLYDGTEDDFNYDEYLEPTVIEDELELDVGNESDISDYYDDLIDSNPGYAEFEEEIKSCKTLIEAQKKVLRYSKFIESKKPMKKMSEKISDNGVDVARIKNSGWL